MDTMHDHDDERDAMIRRLAQDTFAPPPAPREELWARIQAARQAETLGTATTVRTLRTGGGRRWAPLAWPVGIAALLALAFGLGRYSAPTTPAPTPVAESPAAPSTAHLVAATDYLGRSEAFLTDFRVQARAGQPAASAPAEARRLLGTARLLLDSPVAEDVRLRALLEDLELVLVQIAQLPDEPRRDLDLITNGLDQRGTLGRLRAAVPAGGAPAFSQGVL